MRYYRILTDDICFADRWFLGEPVSADGSEIDAREFRYGRPYQGISPHSIPINQAGKEVLFNLAAFDMPVVSRSVIESIADLTSNEFQRFPIIVAGRSERFEIINTVCSEECVDEARSTIVRWCPEDGRPDRNGRFRMITDLHIDRTRVQSRQIFRITDWSIALIVSEAIKDRLETLPSLGVVFSLV